MTNRSRRAVESPAGSKMVPEHELTSDTQNRLKFCRAWLLLGYTASCFGATIARFVTAVSHTAASQRTCLITGNQKVKTGTSETALVPLSC
jgi:hypothetical protein